ncbi:MAG TPA: hypothetical protein VIR63_05000 [Pontiella sp.]
MKSKPVISLFIASLIAASTSAEIVFETDFSDGLSSSKLTKMGTHSREPIEGQWVTHEKWNFGQVSVLSTSKGPTAPLDSSGGAAAWLGNKKHATLLLDKTWDKNKEYSITVRSRLTNEQGENIQPSSEVMFDLNLAGISPNNKFIWIAGGKDITAPSTGWRTTTRKVELEESKIDALHGRPIIIRFTAQHITNPKEEKLWFDSIKLESKNKGSNEKPVDITQSFERKSKYLAEKAAKDFNLTSEQKNKVYRDIMMYLQCRAEIENMTDLNKARKYRNMVEKAYNKAMLEAVGLDALSQLEKFNEEVSSMLD